MVSWNSWDGGEEEQYGVEGMLWERERGREKGVENIYVRGERKREKKYCVYVMGGRKRDSKIISAIYFLFGKIWTILTNCKR